MSPYRLETCLCDYIIDQLLCHKDVIHVDRIQRSIQIHTTDNYVYTMTIPQLIETDDG